MQAEYHLDFLAIRQDVVVSVMARQPFTTEFSHLIDSIFSDTAEVVGSQGFTESSTDASLVVVPIDELGDGRLRQYKLLCNNIHPSVWRVLSGLLHSFDISSMSLDSIKFIAQTGMQHTNEQILTIPYPRLRATGGLRIERDDSGDYRRSVEIGLTSTVRKEVVSVFLASLNSWLRICLGGFFLDGQHPVTNAHDCPGFVEVGGPLLVARFEGYSGSEAAFDVLLNEQSFLQSRFGCIEGIRIY